MCMRQCYMRFAGSSLRAACKAAYCFWKVVVEIDIDNLVVLPTLSVVVKAHILQQHVLTSTLKHAESMRASLSVALVPHDGWLKQYCFHLILPQPQLSHVLL